jgi:hypothetical protein
MLPTGLAGVAVFLFFVAPGALWDARIRRRRPAIAQSTTRELATVALWSLVFSVIAAAIVIGVAKVVADHRLQELDAWLRADSPRSDTLVVVVFGLAQLLTSLALVLLADLLFGARLYGKPVLRDESAWTAAFKTNTPTDSRPFVIATLHDGSAFSGLVEQFSADLPLADRELTLVEPIAAFVDGEPQLQTEIRRVVLAAPQVQSLEIQYLAEDEIATLSNALEERRIAENG